MTFNNNITKTIALLALLSMLSTHVSAAQQSVIVASNNIKIQDLSKKQLEKIFLGKTTILEDGTRINLALSTQNSKKVNNFFDNYIGKSQRRFKKYWLKKVFAGYGIAPKMFKNSKLAIEYVAQRENVIAFVTIDDENPPKDLTLISIDTQKYF